MRRGRVFRMVGLVWVLTLVFVPFRHRTLVRGSDGTFSFREERMWAPLWNQPVVQSGVAEYPFRFLAGAWCVLLVTSVAVVAWPRRAAPRGTSS